MERLPLRNYLPRRRWCLFVMLAVTATGPVAIVVGQAPGISDRPATSQPPSASQSPASSRSPAASQWLVPPPVQGSRNQPGRRVAPWRGSPPPLARPNWFLGIEVEYGTTGAHVMRVLPNSPASRAGLEAGDLVVTVGGIQVGMVGGRLMAMDRQLDLAADRQGRVALLVWDNRQRQLMNIAVRLQLEGAGQMPDRPVSVVGMVVAGGQVPGLPREAVLTVALFDDSGNPASRQPLAQRRYQNLGPFPIPFELSVAAGLLAPEGRYQLRAWVTVQGFDVLVSRPGAAVAGRELLSNRDPRQRPVLTLTANH